MVRIPAGERFFAPIKKNSSRLQPLMKLPRLSFKSNSSDICRFMFSSSTFPIFDVNEK